MLEIQLTVPKEGYKLLLKDQKNKVLGTIYIEPNGLKFARPKQKKLPSRSICWKILNRLMEVGL